MSETSVPTTAGKPLPVEARQRALAQELASLLDVVEPAPLLDLLLVVE